MKRFIYSLALLIVLPALPISLSIAATAPAFDQQTPTAAKKVAADAWDKLVAEARKEGTVVVAGGFVAEARDAVTAAFRKKYGINTEWIVGRGAELAVKIGREKSVGLSTTDVAIPGTPAFANTFKPQGITVPLDQMLVLPEVKEPKNWREGELPFYDKDKHSLQVVLSAMPFYAYNTDLVKSDDLIHSIDLLNPKWKGKIVLTDPSISGNSNDWFTFTVIEILGREKGLQFMKDFVKQEPVIVRDDRLLIEGVARGKYSIGIGASPAIPIEFIKKGAKVAFADMKEPRELAPGWGLLCAFTNPPHPNTQKLFVNWILSKEGSSVFAPALGYPSNRIDVSTDSFFPALISRKGDVDVYRKYDFLTIKNEMMEIAKNIFSGPAK